ncbi:MAG TPA: penicillin acylase family protein, partial [Phycisphaerae bacterium]|nr:penicillin acylase family protein [Phycisphaerae bacterium]
EINRHQRVDSSKSKTFSDDLESLPVPGVDSSTGVFFAYRSKQPEGEKRRYGITGRGYAATIEFGDTPRARSILPYGQSDDPASAHWFDQAPLYVAGKMKSVHFTREDVEAHAVRSYRPGE